MNKSRSLVVVAMLWTAASTSAWKWTNTILSRMKFWRNRWDFWRVKMWDWARCVKNIKDNFDQTVTDLQTTTSPIQYLKESVINRSYLSYRIILFRFAVIPIANRKAKLRGKIQRQDYPTHHEFLEYREDNTRSFSEWFKAFGNRVPASLNSEIFY